MSRLVCDGTLSVATPGVCANRMYASIGGRCCAHCGQQIHHDGHAWRHIATTMVSCATNVEAHG